MNKKILRIMATVIAIIVPFVLLQQLLMPKYMSGVIEGAFIAEYYEENHDHDVLFIGDCEVYENFVPAVLWEEYGINSYIRGSAQQLIWQSYYLLEDSLKYETPDVVIFNVLSMQYGEPQKETYNRMSIDGMEWSLSKINNINASMLEEESFLDYLFPIFRYHSRWNDIGYEDIEYLFDKDTVTFNGYYMRNDIKPVGYIPEGNKLADYNFSDNAYDYLDKIVALCKQNDIELLLVKAPSLYPYWYDEWDMQMETYADENELLYINYLDLIDETELDFSTDTYDAGLHLNLSGATKITMHIGDFLTENYNLQSRKEEQELSIVWDEKLQVYYDNIEKQLQELE